MCQSNEKNCNGQCGGSCTCKTPKITERHDLKNVSGKPIGTITIDSNGFLIIKSN